MPDLPPDASLHTTIQSLIWHSRPGRLLRCSHRHLPGADMATHPRLDCFIDSRAAQVGPLCLRGGWPEREADCHSLQQHAPPASATSLTPPSSPPHAAHDAIQQVPRMPECDRFPAPFTRGARAGQAPQTLRDVARQCPWAQEQLSLDSLCQLCMIQWPRFSALVCARRQRRCFPFGCNSASGSG